jgi:chromosome segregation ATPase
MDEGFVMVEDYSGERKPHEDYSGTHNEIEQHRCKIEFLEQLIIQLQESVEALRVQVEAHATEKAELEEENAELRQALNIKTTSDARSAYMNLRKGIPSPFVASHHPFIFSPVGGVTFNKFFTK